MLQFIKQQLAESDREFSEESKRILESAENQEELDNDLIAEYASVFGGIDEVSVEGNGDTSKFVIEGARKLDLDISLFDDDVDVSTIELDLTSGRVVDVPMDAQVASQKEEFKAASTFDDFYKTASERMYPMAREPEEHFEARVMEAAEREFDNYLRMCKEQGLFQFQRLSITDEDVPNRVLIEHAGTKIPVNVSFEVDDDGNISHNQLETIKEIVASSYETFNEFAEYHCPGTYPVAVSVFDNDEGSSVVIEYETNDEPLYVMGTKSEIMESYAPSLMSANDASSLGVCVNKRTAIKYLAEKLDNARKAIAAERPELKRQLDTDDDTIFTEAIDFGNTEDTPDPTAGVDAAGAMPDAGNDGNISIDGNDIGGDIGGDATGAVPDSAENAGDAGSTEVNDISNDISNAITNDVSSDPANGGMGEPTFTGDENNGDPMSAMNDIGGDTGIDTPETPDTTTDMSNDISSDLDNLTNDASNGLGNDTGFASAVNLDTMSMDQITQIGIKKLRSLPMEQLKNFINGTFNESAEIYGDLIQESKNICDDIDNQIELTSAALKDRSKDTEHLMKAFTQRGTKLNKVLSKAAKKDKVFDENEISKINDLNQSLVSFITTVKTKKAADIRSSLQDYLSKAKTVQEFIKPKKSVKKAAVEVPEEYENSLIWKEKDKKDEEGE